MMYRSSEESKSFTTVLSNLPLGYDRGVFFERTWRTRAPSRRSADTVAYQEWDRACSKSTALKHKIREAFKERKQKGLVAILERRASVAEVKGDHQSSWHSEFHFPLKYDDSTAARTAVMSQGSGARKKEGFSMYSTQRFPFSNRNPESCW